MEKLKNLVNPGKAQDDEVLYGSGKSTEPVLGGTDNTPVGHGAHHGTNTTGTNPSSTTGNTTSGLGSTNTTAGPHSSDLANKADPRVDSDRDGSRTAGATGTTSSNTTHHDSSRTGTTGYGTSTATAGPHSSNLANKADPRVDSDRDGSRTADTTGTTSSGHTGSSTAAGVLGTSNTTHHDSTTAGPHSSNVANKADPRVDSDRDGSRTTGLGATSGVAHSSTGTGSGTTSSSYNSTPTRGVSDDNASTTAIRHGVAGNSHHTGSGLTGSQTTAPIRHDAPGLDVAGNVDKPLPQSPATGTHGTATTGTALPDRSVGSSGVIGGNTTSTGLGSHTTGSNTARPEHSASGPGSYGTGTTIAGYDADREGDAAPPGMVRRLEEGVWKFTKGPHPTDTGNRLDPRVPEPTSFDLDDGIDDRRYHELNRDAPGHETHHHSSTTTGTTGTHGLSGTTGATGNTGTSGTSATTATTGNTGTGHHAGGAALGAGTVAAGSAAAGAGHRDPSHPSTGPAPNTAGPHKSDLLNKMDPRVDSNLDGSKTAGSVPGTEGNVVQPGSSFGKSPYAGDVDPRVDSTRSGTTGTTTAGTDSHHGRDAALVGGGAAAGAGAYEAGKHHHTGTTSTTSTSGTTGTTGTPTGVGYGTSSTTAGPHSSNLTNKADPRVDSDRDGSHTTKDDTKSGSSKGGLLGFLHKDKSHDTTHHEKTHNTTQQDKTHDHHGRDAAVVGGGAAAGAGAYEAGRHHHDETTGTTGTTRAAGTGHATTTTAGPHSSNVANKADPRVDSDLDGSKRVGDHTTSETHKEHKDSKGGLLGFLHKDKSNDKTHDTTHHDKSHDATHDQHHGRDAAVVGGGAAAGAGAYEAGRHHERDGRDPTTGTTSTTGVGHGSSTTAGLHDSNLANKADPRVDSDLDGSRRVGDSTTTGTGHHHGRDAAAVGGAGTAGYAADHELSKQEKHHQVKELDREQKREHHGTAHQKDHKDEKEHKGLLGGLLHRDKTDKTHDKTHDTTHDKHHEKHHGAETAAGVGATGAVAEHERHEHGDRNRLHKDPPAGYASNVTGGAGTSTSAHGSSVPAGSHTTGAGTIGSHTSNRGENTGLVKEPITGLPMDVAHQGSGAGGTDANPIPGYHQGATGTTGTTGHGVTGTSSTTAGPHSANLANKADPRVDSDLDGSRTAGTGTTTGTH